MTAAGEALAELEAHRHGGRVGGFDEEPGAEVALELGARRWREVGTLSPRLRALLEVAEKLSASPTRMVAGDCQPLRDLGFDDHACLESHIVGLFNYLTRLAGGLGLQLDPQTLEASRGGRALQRPGWPGPPRQTGADAAPETAEPVKGGRPIPYTSTAPPTGTLADV